MRVDGRRLARGLAMAAWAATFDYLWLSGEAVNYVGPRTTWVVPFGGILLTLAAVGYLAGVRTSGPGRGPSVRELLGLAALLAPVLAILAVPSPQLGAQAVAKKNAPRAPQSAAYRVTDRDAAIGIADVAIASESESFARERGIRPGLRVRITGFVSKTPDDSDAWYELSRFEASCCAADALPFTVRVEARGSTYATDQWVRAAGRLVFVDGEYRLRALAAERIDAPANPYL